jgi:hypothetical protein
MEERRRHQRLVPESPLFARVEGSKGGPVLDLSEGGLAFGGVIHNSVFSMALDLPDGNGLIQARAEIAWTSHARDITGVRFVQLADNCRQRLKNWIAARAYPAGEEVELEDWPSAPLEMVLSDTVLKSGLEEPNSLQLGPTSKRRASEIVLSAVILCSAFVCIGYYLPNIGGRPKAGSETTIAQATEKPSNEVVFPVNAATPNPDLLPPRLPLDIPGYVVQVGAMAQENNADALAVTLHRKSFPAFVFRRDGDRFYRVAVGPYSDENSTMQVKEQIEKAGFATILRNWSPE